MNKYEKIAIELCNAPGGIKELVFEEYEYFLNKVKELNQEDVITKILELLEKYDSSPSSSQFEDWALIENIKKVVKG